MSDDLQSLWAARSGRPAASIRRGGESFILELAGLKVALRHLEPAALELLEKRFSGFLGEPGEIDIEIEIAVHGLAARPLMLDRDTEYRVSSGGTVFEGRALVATVGERRAQALLVDDPVFLTQEIENLLRVLSARELVDRGALVLHAAAVELDGKAFCFPATTGTGKSTLTRDLVALGLTPLGDDMVALELTPEQVRLHPLPFTGELALQGDNRARALTAILPLERGELALLPIPASLAAARLAEQTPILGLYPELADEVLDLVTELAGRVATKRLRRSLSDNPVGLLETLIP